MNEFTISIIGNKIFFEIISKIKLFSKYNIKFYEINDLFAKLTIAYTALKPRTKITAATIASKIESPD